MLRFCRLDSRAWTLSSSIAAATRRFWLATISAVMVGAHCETTAAGAPSPAWRFRRPPAAKRRDLFERALRRGDQLIPVGKSLCGHAAERPLERLIGRFAEIRNRRHLRIRRGIGGIQRKIGRAALAGPLAGARQQQIGGFVDRRGIGSRGAFKACVVQDVA